MKKVLIPFRSNIEQKRLFNRLISAILLTFFGIRKGKMKAGNQELPEQ